MRARPSLAKLIHSIIIKCTIKLLILLIVAVSIQNLSFAKTIVTGNSPEENSLVKNAERGDETKGSFILSLGYGKLNISQFIFTDQELGFRWNLYDIELGYCSNSIGTQVLLDFLFSDSRGNQDLGPRDLVGGGQTEEYVSNQHLGGFLGIRQLIYWRLYLSAGIGILDQERNFTFSVNVSNAGGTHSVTNTMWYWGINIRVLDKILVGIKRYDTIDTWESYELYMNSMVYQITYMF